MTVRSSPVIAGMRVIPATGHDNMLPNIDGTHNTYSIRNIVALTDSTGHTDIGETPGGEVIYQALVKATLMVLGQEAVRLNKMVQQVHKGNQAADLNTFGKGVWIFGSRVNAVAASETTLLDLLGQALSIPVCKLLGSGKQHDVIIISDYLFYTGNRAETDLPCLKNASGNHEWHQLQHQKTMGSEAVVRLTEASQDRYGFKDSEFEGGVSPGGREIDTVRTLKKRSPDARITADLSGVWLLDEAISLCKGLSDILTYVEDPCGVERGFFGYEMMVELRWVTGLSVTTNMITINRREMSHAVMFNAVGIPLVDPRFWILSGTVCVAQLCDDWGLTWDCHSNNHFDIPLAMFTHVGVAAPGSPTVIDTHQVWQEGDRRSTESPLEIKNGKTAVPDASGLGVELDWEQVQKVHKVHEHLPDGTRNDAGPMQYLAPGRTFDRKRPVFGRY